MPSTDDIISAIISEAAGEGPDGMAAVAWTIANRAAEKGISPAAVVTKKGQYTGLENPGSSVVKDMKDPAMRAKVAAIWSSVSSGKIPDPTGGATHYWAPGGMKDRKDPGWAYVGMKDGKKGEETSFGRTPIGNHVYLSKGPVGGKSALAAIDQMAPIPAMMTPGVRSGYAPSGVPMPPQRAMTPTGKFANGGGQDKNRRMPLDLSIAMQPTPGGKSQSPLFDAGYSPADSAMRGFNKPTQTWGMTWEGQPNAPASGDNRGKGSVFAKTGLVDAPNLKTMNSGGWQKGEDTERASLMAQLEQPYPRPYRDGQVARGTQLAMAQLRSRMGGAPYPMPASDAQIARGNGIPPPRPRPLPGPPPQMQAQGTYQPQRLPPLAPPSYAGQPVGKPLPAMPSSEKPRVIGMPAGVRPAGIDAMLAGMQQGQRQTAWDWAKSKPPSSYDTAVASASKMSLQGKVTPQGKAVPPQVGPYIGPFAAAVAAQKPRLAPSSYIPVEPATVAAGFPSWVKNRPPQMQAQMQAQAPIPMPWGMGQSARANAGLMGTGGPATGLTSGLVPPIPHMMSPGLRNRPGAPPAAPGFDLFGMIGQLGNAVGNGMAQSPGGRFASMVGGAAGNALGGRFGSDPNGGLAGILSPNVTRTKTAAQEAADKRDRMTMRQQMMSGGGSGTI